MTSHMRGSLFLLIGERISPVYSPELWKLFCFQHALVHCLVGLDSLADQEEGYLLAIWGRGCPDHEEGDFLVAEGSPASTGMLSSLPPYSLSFYMWTGWMAKSFSSKQRTEGREAELMEKPSFALVATDWSWWRNPALPWWPRTGAGAAFSCKV